MKRSRNRATLETTQPIGDVRSPRWGRCGWQLIMGKLTNLKPRLATVRNAIVPMADNHGHSQASEPWRRWYNTKRWRQLRWLVLVRDLFTCGHCGRVEGETSRLVAHHVRAHRGDPTLFWDEANLQCVCKACHDGPIAAKEAAQRARGEL